MDVIINPTNECNFACKFCAASAISHGKLSSKETIEKLSLFKDTLNMIIVNGGDPLIMDPQYYYDILNWCRSELNRIVPISMTTNLIDFYRNPEKWIGLFREKEIGIGTSFQYGNKRGYIENGKFIVYDEKMFRDVISLFFSLIGYKPSFIYVTDRDNEQYLFDIIELSKELKIGCKINKAIIDGRYKEYYPRYRLFEKYLEIIRKYGFEVEDNIYNHLHKYFEDPDFILSCDMNRYCYKDICTITPNGSIVQCSHISYMDEKEIEKYRMDKNPDNNYRFRKKYYSIKSDCYGCEWDNICNSCAVYIREVRNNNDENQYCSKMRNVLELIRDEYRKERT